MKRRDNGRSNAAVQGFQSCERGDGLWVTDDAGNGPSAGRVCSLALCAGFWLGHLLSKCRAQGDHPALFGLQLCGIGGAKRATEAIAACRSEEDAAEAAVLSGCDGLHFVLRAGPIPTMCQSYGITSDASTTVRRVDA